MLLNTLLFSGQRRLEDNHVHFRRGAHLYELTGDDADTFRRLRQRALDEPGTRAEFDRFKDEQIALAEAEG